jgi:hypothetical protein
MRRLLSIAVFGAAFWAAQPAGAQPPRPGRSGGEELRKLETELDRLKAQTKELEAKLAKAKEATDRPARPERKADGPPEHRGPGGPRGFDGHGPRFGPPGPPHGGSRGFGPPGRGGPGAGSTTDLVRRIDRIIRELEQIRSEVERHHQDGHSRHEAERHHPDGHGRRADAEIPPPRPKGGERGR